MPLLVISKGGGETFSNVIVAIMKTVERKKRENPQTLRIYKAVENSL